MRPGPPPQVQSPRPGCLCGRATLEGQYQSRRTRVHDFKEENDNNKSNKNNSNIIHSNNNDDANMLLLLLLMMLMMLMMMMMIHDDDDDDDGLQVDRIELHSLQGHP